MGIKIEVSGPGAETARQVSGAARGALRRVFGPALEEFGAMLGDHVRAFRIQNLLRLDAKLRLVAKDRGLKQNSLHLLPVGDAVRTLYAASMEDEDDVQELWARLIVKAASNSREEERRVDKLYIELLRSLSAADAALLELLQEGPQFRSFMTPKDVEEFNRVMEVKAAEKWRKFSEEARDVSVQNLTRLRCITFAPRLLNADNLMMSMPRRMGGLEFRNSAVVDPRRMEEVLTDLLERVYMASGAMEPRDKTPIELATRSAFGTRRSGMEITVPEFSYYLTPLGMAFIKAVTIPRK